MEQARRHTYGKTERLKSRKQIQALFSRGKQFTHAPFRLFWLPGDGPDKLQAGVGVSNRLFSRAVDRNRVKRLVREAWRVSKAPLMDHLEKSGKSVSVFLVYTGKELPVYEDLLARMPAIVNRLKTLSDGKDLAPA